jgi:hypothetical protein
MENNIDLEVEGIDFKVYYEVDPYDPGDRYTPPSGGGVFVTDILLKGVSIIDIIKEDIISNIENQITEL